MKKLVLLASVFALILSSCTQDLPDMEENVLQDVIFTASTELKYDMFDCDNEKPDYALLTFTVDDDNDINTPEVPYPTGGGEINTPVFYVNDVMYTQAIKLPANKSYTLIDMRLYATGAGVGGADLLVNAVPYTGSHYGNLITAPVPVSINVSPFTKTEVPISILCYDDTQYEDFGFTWFRIEENIVRTKYFFGDFCTKFFEDYKQAPKYQDYLDLVRVDMPVIMKLDLYQVAKDDIMFDDLKFIDSFTNEATLLSGSPLLLAYPDMEATGDIFQIDVNLYVKVGSEFEYVNFGSWFWNDNEELMYVSLDDLQNNVNSFNPGTDGVYDFILGNCNVDGADFAFAPYMNLPGANHEGQVNMVVSVAEEGNRTSYLIANLTGIGGQDSGYDMWDGLFEAYCFDLDHTITANGTHVYQDISIYSTLYPANLPTYMQNENWAAVNWLANNYKEFTGWTWEDLQQALWTLEDNGYVYDPNGNIHGVSANLTMVNNMVATAISSSANGYQPMPGGWAAVVLEAGETVQTIFTIVDP